MKDNGGPAFPVMVSREQLSNNDNYVTVREPEGGMSLRDYFAGQALVGGVKEFFAAGDCWDDYNDFAKTLYGIADAMLAERAK